MEIFKKSRTAMLAGEELNVSDAEGKAIKIGDVVVWKGQPFVVRGYDATKDKLQVWNPLICECVYEPRRCLVYKRGSWKGNCNSTVDFDRDGAIQSLIEDGCPNYERQFLHKINSADDCSETIVHCLQNMLAEEQGDTFTSGKQLENLEVAEKLLSKVRKRLEHDLHKDPQIMHAN